MLHIVPTQTKPMLTGQVDTAMDEYALLQRIIEGDMLAFEAFYKLYYPKLFGFIQRMTRQPETVEELIQETLLVVWEKPRHYNHKSKLSTWVFGIAYNKALKSLAKHARTNDANLDDVLETLRDPSPNPAQHLENADWLGRALAALPPDQRAVIELTFYHGLPYQDIAVILDCPENTVKTRMFHARKRLQAFAETQGN
ncbi:MAG: RNA polymerase sigma factor [Methylovulum miyakonense]|uniref:RNA polymerase sigma factor n=1 Tax=Methylovulum miyakonense TaxID=645578 RepID=UPI003BB5CFE0